jgi:hypothetical protein
MKPLGISINRLARDLDVSTQSQQPYRQSDPESRRTALRWHSTSRLAGTLVESAIRLRNFLWRGGTGREIERRVRRRSAA